MWLGALGFLPSTGPNQFISLHLSGFVFKMGIIALNKGKAGSKVC